MALFKLNLLTILVILVTDQVNGLPGLYLRPYNGPTTVHKFGYGYNPYSDESVPEQRGEFGYGYKPRITPNLGETVTEKGSEVRVPAPERIVKRNTPGYQPSTYGQSQFVYPQTEFVQPTDLYGMQRQHFGTPVSHVPQAPQYMQYPHINPSLPQIPYHYPIHAYPEISGQTVYTDYLQTGPNYLGLERLYPGVYPHGHPNVQIRPSYGHRYPNCLLPSKIPTPQGEIDVELVDVRPYKPRTEPLGHVPMVKSIEMIQIPNTKVDKHREEVGEDNEIQSNSFGSKLFGFN